MNHFKCFAESPWRPLFQRGSIALIHRWGAGFLAVSALLLGGSSVLAADGTWVGAGSGNYSDAAKWTGGVVAGGTGATATVNLGTSGATTITHDAAVTLGTFQLANSTNGQNFGWSGGGTATSSTVTWATSSGTPQLLLNSWFSKTYTLGSGNLTFAGTQGLIINVGSNVAAPSSGGLSWAGFSGTLTVINGGSGDGTLDPQSGGSLPAQHLSLLPGAAGSVTLGMFASRDQTIGGFDGTSAAYVRNNSTSFSTLTLGSNNDSGDFAGVFGRNVNSASTDYRSNINLTKTGSGTQKFSGTTYSGGTTTVTGGVYLVNGTHRAVVTASGNVAATTGTGGQYSVGGTLGGTGTIIPFDTAGGGVMVNVASGGVLAPGDPSINGGLGSLTLDQTNSAKSVLNFSTGGKAGFVLGAGGANSKVAIIGSASLTEVFFNGTAFNFTDLTAGGLTAGTYVLFQGDANTNYSGTIGAITGLANYAGSTVQIAGNNVTLTLAPASVPTTVPGAPTGLAAAFSNNQVSLGWTAPSTGGAVATYNVKRSTVSGSYSGSPLATVTAPATTFTDTTAVNGTKYYYVVSASNSAGEGVNSTEANATPVAPTGVSIDLKPANATGMTLTDVAGAGVARLGKWNDLTGPTGQGGISKLTNLVDSTGASVAGMTTTFTGGNTASGTFNLNGEPGNDATMISGAYDQYDGTASTIAITGIPYASYDLYLYMWSDGASRAGAFTVNGTTYYMRGGLGNPTTTGTGYVRSTDTTYGAGTDIDQGNYVRVTGLTASSVNCSVVAVYAGDGVNRCKFSGYQIVAATAPVVTTPPSAPASVQVVAGNNQTTIQWNASNTATIYYVKRSTDGINFTTIATLNAFSNSYVDTTAVNGATYYYLVTAANGLGESPNSSLYASNPYDPQAVAAFGVKLQAIGSYGIAVSDLAGVPRIPYWNNLVGPTLQGETVSLPVNASGVLLNNLGLALPGTSVLFTAGKTTPATGTGSSFTNSGTLNLASDTATTNEDSLFASVFDQYDTTPSTLNVTGIPYATYDALFFVYDGGAARGGSVTVNGTTYDVRGGAGTPVSAGSGYVQSNGTTGGTSAAQGNYVRFSGLSGNLTASLVASNLGDSTQRLKFAGFQIVSRDAYVAPTQVPAAPTGLTASGGNTQVGLNWAASPSATAYKVYRGGSLLTTVPSPLLSYADTAVTNGAGYTYTVSAVNGVGEGPLSASASATPALPSFTPPKRVVFQYSVPVVPIFSTAYPADPYRRAYLWVPPGLNRIQGVFFSMHNMLEKPMVDDPVIRQACADAGVAIVFVSTQSASPNSPGATNGAPVGLPRNMAMDGDPNNYRSADTISTTAITGSSVGNPSTFTTSAAHGLTTGDVVTISGHNATPAVNGLYTVTVTSATTFTIPVNVTGAGTGGTVGKNQMADVNARSDIRNATQGVRFANQSEQAGAEVQVLLQSLAAESGYSELAYAPIMISGHSAASTFVWVRSVFTSAAMAGRTFGILSNKGTFPGNLTSLSPSGNSYQGIPILHVSSEWVEISTWGNTWLHSDQPSARNLRGGGVNCLLGEVVQPGTGHYDYSEPQSAVFGQFIKSAAATRIPANWPVNTYPTLNTIDPASGYLIDPTKVITGSCQPVAYADWVGAGKDPVRAFWYPDLATAQSAAETQNAGFSRRPQQINVFTVNGSTLAPLATTSAGLASVSPVLLADGTTFKMQAASVNQSIVTRLFNAAPLGIASGPILWKGNDSGAIKQVGPDTFRIYMDRNNPVTNGQPYEPFAIAVHLGDSQYRMADRPAFITTAIPVYNVPGTAQTVTFPTPPNQVTTNLHPITFTSATASSGLPVQYWVASGPYRVDETTTNGETIIPDPIPPKSKLPMRVVIGAWQWGRPSQAGTTIATAPLVYKEFWIGLPPVNLSASTSGGTPILVTNLLVNAGFDPATISSVTVGGTSANGGTVTRSGSGTGRGILYTPPANFTGTDSFTYTITLASGGTSTWSVNVNVSAANAPAQSIFSLQRSGGNVSLGFVGVSGLSYRVESADSLLAPVTWTNLGTATESSAGVYQFIDAPPPTRRPASIARPIPESAAGQPKVGLGCSQPSLVSLSTRDQSRRRDERAIHSFSFVPKLRLGCAPAWSDRNTRSR